MSDKTVEAIKKREGRTRKANAEDPRLKRVKAAVNKTERMAEPAKDDNK